MLTEKQSRTLYVVKAFALFLIVWAHMSIREGQTWIENTRISVCQIGVAAFFVISGFFYKRASGDSREFWLKKLKTIVIPWLLLSSSTFGISLFLSNSYSNIVVRYVKWILGIGAPYWYMSQMVLCFFLFKLLPYKKNAVLYGCIGISIVSVLLSALSIIRYNLVWNQYTNPLNWIGFFAVGILIRQKGILEKLALWKLAAVSVLILIICVAWNIIDGTQTEAYIGILSLPIEIFGSICVLFLAKLCCESRLIVDIGRTSFFVYLVHIQVAGVINSRIPDHPGLLLIKPLAAVLVCYLAAKCMKWFLEKIKLYEKLGCYLSLR